MIKRSRSYMKLEKRIVGQGRKVNREVRRTGEDRARRRQKE